MFDNSSLQVSITESDMYLNLFAIINCVSSSASEPSDIDKKCTNSLGEVRAAPSAIFDGIETTERLIWFVNPNLSLSGNEVVIS